MRRADVIAIALAVAAAAFGVSAGTGPLAGGLGALLLIGLALRARSAQYILVCAVAPFLFWATFPDPSGTAAAGALAAAGVCALLSARERPASPSDGVIAARITLASAMVVTASCLLSFDLLLR
jgi:hypothetical protein